MHGFLLLQSEDGKEIAVGDQINVPHGDEIVSHLVFHFRDGSIDDEVTTFRQGRVFQLVRDHHVQKGPSFPKPLDMTIDVPKRTIWWVETKDGKPETKQQHVEMPDDLVNGIISMVVENFPPTGQMNVSYAVVESKPRIVKLSFWPEGDDKIFVGEATRHARRFNVHIELGGIAGAIAPLVGKQPPDLKIWALEGEAPLFIKMFGPLYQGGPLWTMVLTQPRWPSTDNSRK